MDQPDDPKPENFFIRVLSARRVRAACVCIIFVGVIALIASFALEKKNQTPFKTPLGGDFPQFYIAGKIIDDLGPNRLYDLQLQSAWFTRLFPRQGGSLPFAYPPVVAIAFRPLSFLSYPAAAGIWIGFSALLYAIGLRLLWEISPQIPARRRWMGVALALAFEPFLFECLHGGQVSTIAFFAICAAIFFDGRGRNFLCGVFIGLLAYKPTLLFGLGPLILLRRKWSTLAGIALTLAVGFLVSWRGAGWKACEDFLTMMQTYSHAVAAGDGFRTWKYVDLCSFLRLLHQPNWLACAVPIMGMICVIAILASPSRAPFDAGMGPSTWASALLATVVLNLYVGMYDTILVVPAIWLMVRESYRRGRGLDPAMRILILGVFIAPWVSQACAAQFGLQLDTLVLGGVLVFSLSIGAQRFFRSIDRESVSIAPSLPR